MRTHGLFPSCFSEWISHGLCFFNRKDTHSELPGIHLGTSWTARSAMLMYKKKKKKKTSRSTRLRPRSGRAGQWALEVLDEEQPRAMKNTLGPRLGTRLLKKNMVFHNRYWRKVRWRNLRGRKKTESRIRTTLITLECRGRRIRDSVFFSSS